MSSKEKKMSEEVEVVKREETEELSLDSLDSVVGGVGLRNAPKKETEPISSDTIDKA